MKEVIPFHGDMSLCQTNGKNDITLLSNKKNKNNNNYKKWLYIQPHRFYSLRNIIKQLGYG
jgi:hypothetical protein